MIESHKNHLIEDEGSEEEELQHDMKEKTEYENNSNYFLSINKFCFLTKLIF